MYDRIVRHCELDARSLVLDVGAGPGKGTRPLIERGIPVLASEPSPSMIRQGLEFYPNLQYVCSAAEELPFPAGQFDLVTAAQSFHWFDHAKALAEFFRVLRPRGFLAVYWNDRAPDHAPAKFLEDLATKYNPSHQRDYRTRDWRTIVEQDGYFRVAYHAQYSFTVPMQVDDWIGLARSISYVQTIGDEKLREFEAELRSGMSQFHNVDCAYVTGVWLSEKTGKGCT